MKKKPVGVGSFWINSYIENESNDYKNKTLYCPCLDLDRKMLLIWNLAQPYFAIIKKKMVEKNFKTAAIGMMTALIVSIFFKYYVKSD